MSLSAPLAPGTACLVCRRKKTKCDGVQPTCGRCSRLGKICVFEGGEVDAPGRRARTDELFAKIVNLETELDALKMRESLNYPRSILAHRLFAPPQSMKNQAMTREFLPIYPSLSCDNDSFTPLIGNDAPFFNYDEPYPSLIPRSVVETMLLQWNPSEDMPLQLENYLIRLFLPHRVQFRVRLEAIHFLPRASSFFRAHRIHPALLNAIFLIACSVSGGIMSSFEPLFLRRVRTHLEQSLAFADRLVDFMWASTLLSMYFFRAGRTIEAYHSISATVRFASGCKLDSLDGASLMAAENGGGGTGSADWEGDDEFSRISLLPVARDEKEMVARRQLWYAIYEADRMLCQAAGMPSSIPAQYIAKVHHIVFEHKSKLREQSQGLPTLTAALMFTPLVPPGFEVGDSSYINSICVLVKFVSLIEGIEMFSSKKDVDESEFWMTYDTMAVALSACREHIPSMHSSAAFDPREQIGVRGKKTNPSVFLAHMLFHAGSFLLQDILMKRGDLKAHTRIVEIVNDMANLVKEMMHFRSSGSHLSLSAANVSSGGKRQRGMLPAMHCDISLMPYLFGACDILVRELESRREMLSGSPDVADHIQKCHASLEILMDALADFIELYPAWAPGCELLRRRVLEGGSPNLS